MRIGHKCTCSRSASSRSKANRNKWNLQRKSALCTRYDIILGVAMFKVTDVNITCSSAHSPSIPCIAGASAGPRARRASATLPGSSYNAIGLCIDRHKCTPGPDNGQTRSQHSTKHYHCIQTLLVTPVLLLREVLQRSPVACSHN